MRGEMRTVLRHYGGAVAATALAVLARALLQPALGDAQPLGTLYGAVAFAVWLGGYRPALLAVVLGYLACDYLFIAHPGNVSPHDARDLAELALYLLSCAVIVGLGEAL